MCNKCSVGVPAVLLCPGGNGGFCLFGGGGRSAPVDPTRLGGPGNRGWHSESYVGHGFVVSGYNQRRLRKNHTWRAVDTAMIPNENR